MPKKSFYGSGDIADLNYSERTPAPGEYPFTRGTRRLGYAEKLWTIRQFAGFGSVHDTNARYRRLLGDGETGLSVAFDMATLLGYDSDDKRAKYDIGKGGVAVCTLEDMEELFDGIPLDLITTSMTINASAAVMLAMYVAVADKRGIPREKIGGTIQNDPLKEFLAQKEWIFPPEQSVRLVVDSVEYCAKCVPRWNTISISGYHIREAGSTAVQELAFTLADGIAYVEECVKRGMDVDDFAPRFSFFFNFHNDFFEEIAKLRAARNIWARVMRERFGAKNERSWMCRMHVQTAGCTLTRQQPLNNIARAAIQVLGAVLGGTQSLHANSYDEEISLPSEEAARVAVRTQQIVAYETGVAAVADPLGGSYYVESLTRELIEAAEKYIKKIDEMGGMISAIKTGFPQAEIRRAAWEDKRAKEEGRSVVVGVNKFVDENEREPRIFEVNPEAAKIQLERVAAFKEKRDKVAAATSLLLIKEAVRENENLMPYFVEAVKNGATLGEICAVLRELFGDYQESVAI